MNTHLRGRNHQRVTTARASRCQNSPCVVKGICLDNEEVERIIMKRVKKATAVRHHRPSGGLDKPHRQESVPQVTIDSI